MAGVPRAHQASAPYSSQVMKPAKPKKYIPKCDTCLNADSHYPLTALPPSQYPGTCDNVFNFASI